jgi:hypothetical protein
MTSVVTLSRQGGVESQLLAREPGVGSWSTFSVVLSDTLPDGVYDVTLSAYTDLADNPGTAVSLGVLAVDNTPPQFLVTPTPDRTAISHNSGDRGHLRRRDTLVGRQRSGS